MGNINYNDRFEIGIVSPSYKVFSIDEKFDKGYIAFLLKTRKALWAYPLVSEQGASIVRRNLNYESFLEISFCDSISERAADYCKKAICIPAKANDGRSLSEVSSFTKRIHA